MNKSMNKKAKIVSFSSSGRYLSVIFEDNMQSVYLYDLQSKVNADNGAAIPMMTFDSLIDRRPGTPKDADPSGQPPLSGVLYDDFSNAFYYTREGDRMIYGGFLAQHGTPSTPGWAFYRDAGSSITLCQFVKSTKGKKMVVRRGTEHFLFDLEGTGDGYLSYPLPMQDLQDCMYCPAHGQTHANLLLLGEDIKDVSVYEGDGDKRLAELRILDAASGECTDELGSLIINDSWDGSRYYPYQKGKYGIPLFEFSNYLPTYLACSAKDETGAYSGVLSAIDEYAIVAEIFRCERTPEIQNQPDTVTDDLKLSAVLNLSQIKRELRENLILWSGESVNQEQYILAVYEDRYVRYQFPKLTLETQMLMTQLCAEYYRVHRFGKGDPKSRAIVKENINRLRYRCDDIIRTEVHF